MQENVEQAHTATSTFSPAIIRGRVYDPGRGTNKPARVANPQQDAGGLQTRPNVEVNVDENVDVNVDVNVVLT